MDDPESKNEFHRAISLQYDCVTDVLRELLEFKLGKSSVTLEKYLRTCHTHLTTKPYVTDDQREFMISRDPDSKDMDLTFLTMVLLAKCNNKIGITTNEKSTIKKLRQHRNTLAHNSTGRLNDGTLFTETSNDIVTLAKSLRVDTQNNIKACIDELKQRVCVRLHSKLEVIEFNQEQLRVLLANEEDTGKVHTDKFNETLLKFNIAKWRRKLTREIDLPKMLEILQKDKIISTAVVERVHTVDRDRDKVLVFLEFLIKEGEKLQILQFCKMLRAQSESGSHIADLIEGNITDGRDTVEEIKKIEEDQIKVLLQEGLERSEKADESCEDVHIYVEEMLNRVVDFSVINSIMFSLFGCPDNNGRYEGITFKQKGEGIEQDDVIIGENVAAMEFQQFAEYVGNQFRNIDSTVCTKITTAIQEEAISVETFVEMNEEDLKEVFGHHLGPNGYKFGINKQLKRLQSQIQNQIKPTVTNIEGTLRQFDKPFCRQYKKCEISYQLDPELGTPAHEFVLPSSSMLTRWLIEKKSIRFFTACLNARKNGTIHFGIKRTGRSKGEIVGVRCKDETMLESLDDIIKNSIHRCFRHLSLSMKTSVVRCTRSAHIIGISDQNKVVIEIDIVPFDKHLSEALFTTMFPPHGTQQQTFFLLEHNDIVVIAKEREVAVRSELDTAIKERHLLDMEKLRIFRTAPDLVIRLTDELTSGADFITDIFYPIICAGSREATQILDYDGLQDAFQNSMAVFDFGSSKDLRQKIEDGVPIFSVHTVDHFDNDESQVTVLDKEKPWIYCNGNIEKGMESMNSEAWVDSRLIPLEKVLSYIKNKIPPFHAKVIFLAFEEASSTDPMVEFAREAFIRMFKHQCLIIGETPEVLAAYENEITRRIGREKVSKYLFSGLSWFDTCKVFRKTFKECSEDVCRIPNSAETFDELTQKEKAKWKDIDVLSMEECIYEEKQMKSEDQKNKQKEEETKFYQGKKASWWNFYYGHHGERDLFSKLRALIEKKLTRADGRMLVEFVEIEHEPGAGGSILGRHLIWHFSQTRCISQPYRCCVVQRITENTVNEIEQFRGYRDSRPRPVIILLDDQQDGNMFFQKGLHQLAYKTASPGELFGVVINVTRVSLANDPIEEKENGSLVLKPILKHRLTDRERHWFEKKYKELEDADVDVDTLIAFNVMRKSFDKGYIKTTVETILEKVPENELDIIKILALFGTYEIGIFVPSSIFDSFVGFNLETYRVKKPKNHTVGEGKPYGMQQRKSRQLVQPPQILDSHCLSLFACRAGYEMRNRGLRIISQPLAEVILRYVRDKQTLNLEDIVMFVLEHAEYHKTHENEESKRFVVAVCSLFKTREDTRKGKDGVKDKFSRLIFAFLDLQNVHDLETGKESVIRVMEKCFSFTADAFVGQQLARFFIIHKKDFDAAEDAICESIDLCPNNSYLLDTYGQVFKTKMEYIKETNSQHGNKLPDKVANEVVDLAYKATDKFQEGQVTTQEYESKINLSCYHMEVKTLVGLLETFELFECFTNEEDFINVLIQQKEIHETFLSILNGSGSINQIIQDGERQIRADNALRFVEERDYQVKKIYLIYTEEDVLLLNLRERYERFYRSHGLKYQLKFGYGLKPLMKAFDSKDEIVRDVTRRRFKDAEKNLHKHGGLRSLENADTRDLLFFLGFKFIELLRTNSKIDASLYRQMLSYSAKLLDTQRQTDVKRPYLEAYLFYAIFHWPRKNRFEFPNLSTPNSYIRTMEAWEEAFKKNNYIRDREQLKYYKGKNYFALSKDSLCVIDLYEIELEWREIKEKEEGRSRMHVYKDYFWREPFVADRMKRLTGTLDESGKIIKHCVAYPVGDHQFRIRTFYPTEQLRNRQVTFILGFTWSGLRAFDVIEKADEHKSSGDEDSLPEIPHTKRTVKPKDVDYTLYERNLAKSANATRFDKKNLESRSLDKPSYRHNNGEPVSREVKNTMITESEMRETGSRQNSPRTEKITKSTKPLSTCPKDFHSSSHERATASRRNRTTTDAKKLDKPPSSSSTDEFLYLKSENITKSTKPLSTSPKDIHSSSHELATASRRNRKTTDAKKLDKPPSSSSTDEFPYLKSAGSQDTKPEDPLKEMDFVGALSKSDQQQNIARDAEFSGLEATGTGGTAAFSKDLRWKQGTTKATHVGACMTSSHETPFDSSLYYEQLMKEAEMGFEKPDVARRAGDGSPSQTFPGPREPLMVDHKAPQAVPSELRSGRIDSRGWSTEWSGQSRKSTDTKKNIQKASSDEDFDELD